MNLITSLEHAQLAPFRELKKTNFTRWAPYFIAEGRLVSIRLLESDYEVESVLVAESKWESMKPHIGNAEPLIVADDLVNQLVGFQFHAGVMACGKRVKQKQLDVLLADSSKDRQWTLLATPETSLPDNLGSLIRIAAAFGCDGIIVGNRSADAFSRRVIRVSMGNVFNIPIIEPDDFDECMNQLSSRFDCDIVAATLDPNSESLPAAKRRSRTCLMFGNEAKGLSEPQLQLANRRVTLEMAAGIDSLNVANAATVFLYHFTRVCQTF